MRESSEGEESKVDLSEPPSDTQYDPTDGSNVGEPVDDIQKEIDLGYKSYIAKPIYVFLIRW